MFSKRGEGVSSKATNFDAIIGRDSILEGTLKSTGSIRIDGQMKGEITTDGEVIIGQEARTNGDIKSDNIEISGSVEGNILSNGCLKIYSTGSLFGNIDVKSFVIDEGGVFEGMCHINTNGMKKPSTTNDIPNKPQNKPSTNIVKDKEKEKEQKVG